MQGWGLTLGLPSFQCANGVLGHFVTLLYLNIHYQSTAIQRQLLAPLLIIMVAFCQLCYKTNDNDDDDDDIS